MAQGEYEYFRCIKCGKAVERTSRLRCAACEANPEALRATIARHGPLVGWWARVYRGLPAWETTARRYAEKRMKYHRVTMEMAAMALRVYQVPLTAAALEREIDRREIGTARLVAQKEHVGVINEARRGIAELRAMLERARA